MLARVFPLTRVMVRGVGFELECASNSGCTVHRLNSPGTGDLGAAAPLGGEKEFLRQYDLSRNEVGRSLVVKLGISLPEETNEVLEMLAQETHQSKSRLVDTYLREHPLVRRKLSEFRGTEIVYCALCDDELGHDDIKIDTPKYGKICRSCWTEKAGEIVEKHPIF